MKSRGAQQWTGKERSAFEFNEMARTIFAPAYPAIARQAIECCGFNRGFCIDAGCGPGHLSLALAAISAFTIDALDMSHDMLSHAEKNIRDAGMYERIRTVHGDVHVLPYEDSSVDLVVSRGSLFFWDFPERAFSEIYRVIRPGGRTFLGGGFGTPDIRREITAKMWEIDISWEEKVKGNMGPLKDAELRASLHNAQIPDYEIVRDESGFWIVMKK